MSDETLPAGTEYSVIVRILPRGEEVDMELPATSTGKVIKESLLDHEELHIPKYDEEGSQYSYKLVSKGSGKEISDAVTLYEAGVKDGDTLLLMPTIIAG